MSVLIFLLLVLSCAPGFSRAQIGEKTSTISRFKLYAYGDTMHGEPVYYADGNAEIGNRSLSKAKETHPVTLWYSSESPNLWQADLGTNNGTSQSARETTFGFNLPAQTGSGTQRVQFGQQNDAERQAMTPMYFYGGYVLIRSDGGNFYATDTGVDGVKTLVWGNSRADGCPVILKRPQPSTDIVLAGGYNEWTESLQ